MDFEQLLLFQRLAETEHMSNTADELHLSQSTLSNAIQRLENDLGCQLFTRKGRRIYLNENGKAFLPYVNSILVKMGEARATLDEISLRHNSRVTISAPPFTTFPGLFESLVAQHPEVSIVNNRFSNMDLKAKLLSGELDFCVTGALLEGDELEMTVLSKDELVIVMGQHHPLAHLESAPLSRFAREQFCDYTKREHSGSNLQRYCREAGFEAQIDYYVHSSADTLAIVKNSPAVGMMPLRSVKINGQNSHVTYCRLSQPKCFSYLYLYRKKGPHERIAARKVRSHFVSYFKRDSLS